MRLLLVSYSACQPFYVTEPKAEAKRFPIVATTPNGANRRGGQVWRSKWSSISLPFMTRRSPSPSIPPSIIWGKADR